VGSSAPRFMAFKATNAIHRGVEPGKELMSTRWLRFDADFDRRDRAIN
jgi:hypothetical protein